MKNRWSERAILMLQRVRIFFQRFLMILVVIFIGSAMLSIYSFINFVKHINKGSLNTILIGLIILFIIPFISYVLEKGLSASVNNR